MLRKHTTSDSDYCSCLCAEGERKSTKCLGQKFDFFLNNQPDALIIPILFCYKTLHVSGICSAHHQEFSTVHSALVSFVQVSDDRFQAESGWNCSSILTQLGSAHQIPA